MKRYWLIMAGLLVVAGCAEQSTNQSDPAADAVATEGAQLAEPTEAATSIASYAEAAEKLQQEMASSMQEIATSEDVAVMEKSAEALATAMPNPGLEVGTKAPDFTLSNAFGKSLTLSEELEKGPVVLVFYRGSWCPFCNLHLHALQSILPQLQEHNTQLIAITPQKPDESAKELEEKGYPFEVVSDLDYGVTKAYKFYFEMEPELLSVYDKFGIDLEKHNGEGRVGLPIPGTLIIDKDGVIQAVHAETDYKKRMEPAAVLEAVEKINI